jgi:signal transduction histidine kinase/DNA-binding response OmpR family regulator
LKSINSLAIELLKSNPDSAFQLIENIYPDVKLFGDQEILVDVLFTKGRIFEVRQQLDSALVTYEAAKNLAELSNDKSNIASCLIQLGYVYHGKNESQKGLGLLKEALSLANEIGQKNLEAKAANGIGRFYSFLAEFDSSNIFLNHALEINKAIGDKRGMAELYTNIANNYGRATQLKKAVEHFLQSQALMRELKDSSGVSHTYRNIGVTYFFDGKYLEALQNFHKALKVVEGTEHHADIIQNLDFLGEVYMTIEDFENAQLYWEKAGEEYQLAYGIKRNPEFLFKQGRALLLKKDYATAIDIFLEVEKLKKELGQFIEGDFYWNLGLAYEMASKNEAAEASYSKAIELSQSSNTNFIRLKSLYGLGKIAENKGDITQALGYYQQSYNIAKTTGFKENEMAAATGLYRVFKKQNNASQALQYIEISTNIRDSLFNEKNTKEIAKLEAGYAFEKAKQELEFAQKSKLSREANIRRLLWIALGVVGLVLVISLFYYRSKQKANAELSKLNEQILLQKEKLEELDIAKSRFFTNITHEFRTPLTIISGMAGQIMENPQAWAKKGGKMIKQNSANLLNLVNQILDLRKLEAKELKLNMVQGDVVQYLRYLSESYESYAQSKGLQLHFLPAIEKLVMDFDPEKLLRIVSNLLSNAVKYTSDGGNVYLHVNQEIKNGKPLLSLRVEDTGSGITAADLPQIFDRFYQVDDSMTRKGEGTGIGLALTQELVHLMNGTIDVKSTVGKGSTFTVWLPITNDSLVRGAVGQFDSPQLGSLQSSVRQFDSSTVQPTEDGDWQTDELKTGELLPTLLIVEDNPDIRQFLIACLENNYQLLTAANGQEGIDLALEQVPDLIISDVMMPEKDGFELCEILKNDERTSHIPIILLTAKVDLESKISGLKTGADAYLTKPFEQEELMVRLEKLFELRQKLQARYRSFEPKAVPANKEDEFVQKVRQAVLENLSDESYGVPQLCKAVALSRSQLHNKLKALTGQSTSLFVRSIRLQKAKELLENSDLNISEVGYEVGFKNPSHFSSAYQEEFGVPPSKTRK